MADNDPSIIPGETLAAHGPDWHGWHPGDGPAVCICGGDECCPGLARWKEQNPMTDPRIIPDETLAEWKADAEAHLSDDRNVDLLPKTLDPCRDLALIEHGKALAESSQTLFGSLGAARVLELQEQVDTLTRTKRANEEAAYANRNEWQARADAAEQRVADRNKAISDLRLEIGFPDQCCAGWCAATVHDLRKDQYDRLLEVLDALLAEDGA